VDEVLSADYGYPEKAQAKQLEKAKGLLDAIHNVKSE
jgi:hypothetical protein